MHSDIRRCPERHSGTNWRNKDRLHRRIAWYVKNAGVDVNVNATKNHIRIRIWINYVSSLYMRGDIVALVGKFSKPVQRSWTPPFTGKETMKTSKAQLHSELGSLVLPLHALRLYRPNFGQCFGWKFSCGYGYFFAIAISNLFSTGSWIIALWTKALSHIVDSPLPLAASANMPSDWNTQECTKQKSNLKDSRGRK